MDEPGTNQKIEKQFLYKNCFSDTLGSNHPRERGDEAD